MPIDVKLIQADQIVLQTWREPVDAEQMNRLKELMHNVILPAAPDKLHIIADFCQVEYLPSVLVRNGVRMLNNAHPNTGMILFVTQDAAFMTLANILMRLLPRCSLRIVPSVEEALAIAGSLLK